MALMSRDKSNFGGSPGGLGESGRAPRVSVIIPTFNRAHLLRRALASVLSQDFTDFEVLVIDDHSTDGTQGLLDDVRSADPRVRGFLQPENRGVSAARNRGFREARGELIAFLDSDDEWLAGKLARQVTFFDEAPSRVGLLYGAVHTVGASEWVSKPVHRGKIHRVLLRENVIHGTSGVMLRREAVERTGAFDEEIPAIEDWDYWIRLSREFDVDFLPEPMIRYHATPDDLLRKTLNKRENLDARAYLYARHGPGMREAGTAHQFLAESARRHLGAGEPAEAARLAWMAVRQRPGNISHLALLSKAVAKRILPAQVTGICSRRSVAG